MSLVHSTRAKRVIVWFWLAMVNVGLLWADQRPTPHPRNVIIMIGDGMGLASVAHAHYFQFGMTFNHPLPRLAMEKLPVTGLVYTFCADRLVTDSAASATALFTGEKTRFGYLSVDHDGQNLPTLFEQAARAGRRVGIVTSSYIVDATPAATYAHSQKRRDFERILAWLLQNRPDLILGAGLPVGQVPLQRFFTQKAAGAGYTVCSTSAELAAADHLPVLGVFGSDNLPYEWDRREKSASEPHLVELTQKALALLGREPSGFVLLVEGGLVDQANHDNLIQRSVFEVLAFDQCVAKVVAWIEQHGGWKKNLLVVTADHETGELALRNPAATPGEVTSSGKNQLLQPGVFAGANYGSHEHSACPVPLFAAGAGSAQLAGFLDNTDIYRALSGALHLGKVKKTRENARIKHNIY